MSHNAHELELYVDNDADLYRQMTTPIHRSLTTKAARGQYDHDLAVVAFENLANAGAKRYAKEFGGTWNRLFPPAVRHEFAVASARYFEAELGLGNYDHLLPKKYQPKGRGGGPARGHTTKKKVPR